MQDNEREQNPVREDGGDEWSSAAGDPQSLAHGSAQQPPYPAESRQPGHHEETQTDAFWFAGAQPGPGPGAQPGPGPGAQPGPGPGAQPGPGPGGQPPPYPAGWQPPGGGWPPQPGPYGAWGGIPPQPPRQHGRRFLSFLLVAILGIGVGAAAAYAIAQGNSQPSASPSVGAVPSPGTQGAPLQSTGSSKINVRAIAGAVSPSVADITSRLQFQDATAEGTGIVISPSGLVLTNNHVVDGATRITAQIDGTGPAYTARVVGTDRTEDVALLQLEGASGLKAASIGDSSKVNLGDPVVAIGNLGGQGGQPTVTSGTITSLGRTITAGDQAGGRTETLHGVLQTDAPIGSGDSGGPLVNASGQVIGMDTAAASSDLGQSEHIGFAIPVNHALGIAHEIAAGHGSSTIQIGLPAFLGVSVCDISQASRCLQGGFGGFGTGSVAPVSSGALVANSLDGTPAQDAGISAGDVITGLGGASVTSAQSLTDVMSSRKPGDSVTVSWVDTNGQRHTSRVTLVTGPAA